MPIPKPIPPKLSKSKINIGSKIIFKIVPNPATIIGSFISPSPANLCSGESFDITIIGTENNVIYTLQRSNQNIIGQQIIGNGMDQFFTVVSDSSSIYSVSAKSNKFQPKGYDCASIELSTKLSINIEGPISIIKQPVEANVCAGSRASFSVGVENLGEGTILYQWYESTDDNTFLPITLKISTDEISMSVDILMKSFAGFGNKPTANLDNVSVDKVFIVGFGPPI